MDLSAKGLHLLHTDHWLANNQNLIQVWLHAPAWQIGQHVRETPAQRDEDAVRAWRVDDVALYLESQDAEGLAALVRANSVDGGDFVEFTNAICVKDLRCTPFAARKLMKLRHRCLNL